MEKTNTGGRKLRSNVTKEERMAMNELKRDKNIVIFEADKGAAVVVQNIILMKLTTSLMLKTKTVTRSTIE